MEKVADIFSEWLVASNIITKDDRELYAYGFWQGTVLLFNYLTVVVIGIITDMFWQSVVFTLAYGLLRTVAGGFHARTQKNCYFYSIILLMLSLSLIRWGHWDMNFSIIVIAVSVSIIFILAPVQDENKPLDEVENSVYKYRSRIICGFLAMLVWILFLINKTEMASCIAVALMVSSMMLILGEIRNRYVATKLCPRD